MSNVFVFRQPPSGFNSEYFGGGGKGGTTTQSVSIPPEVLARYNAVNARAEDTAKQPFQQYGGEFVAGLNPTQQAGVAATNAASTQAQPYFNAATGLTLSGAQDVGPLTQQQIGYYQNPYTQSVVDPTVKALQQQQGQQLSQQQAEAIRGGAFGGERSGLQRQALRGQQDLATGQAIAPLYQQGYQQAVNTAQGQQGVVAADYARRMQAGQQIAGLGTAAQGAALQGAQAQMAAGQVGQQTQQAQDTAQYQQFLQERGYPFQTAQFLANIAMGTGALSGSTTSTQAPGGFFSDKRLKNDVKEIGETHDGQPIYSYKYNGDDRTQIGLMAQDVEKKHPEAVGLMGGYKTVDYKKATEDAERTHKDMGGGLMPDNFDASSMGGAVMPAMSGEGFMRGGYVGGGLVGNDDWAQIIAANKAALGVYGGAQPMGGGSPGATGIVPQTSMPTPKLVTAGAAPQQRPSGMSTAMQTGKDIAGAYKGGKDFLLGSAADKSAGLIGGGGSLDGKSWFGEAKDFFDKAEGGLIIGRHAYAGGGESEGDDSIPYDPSDVMRGKDPMEGVLAAGSQKHEMLKPGQAPGQGSGGSGILGAAKDVAGLVGAGNTLASAGSWIGSTALPFLMSFSDARVKDNIRPVGKTFDGQNIYSYNIGEGPTQMGLMAQEVLDRKPEAVGQRAGLLTVDYDRATEDASPYASGGLVPRRGYDEGGPVDTGSLFSSIEKKYELPEGYLNRTWQIESGGGKNLYNEGSGAAGHFQFIPGTQKMMGLQNPYDLSESADATARLAAQNREYLRKGGIDEPSAAHLYLAHQQGPLGATRLLSAADRPAGLVVGEKAVTGNRGDPNARGLDFANQIMSKYEGTQGPASGPIPAAIPRPPGLVGAGVDKAVAPTEGKRSLGDIVTSEGFVVPALGFLGSMLASNRPSFGGALGEGIVGGVGAYQGQQKLAADLAKKGAETELTKAEVPRTEMQTQAIKAGIYERRFIPDVGWQVIDKANNKIFYVTDANMNPIKGTGFETNYQQIPVTGDSTAPKTSTAVITPSGTRETDISKLVKPSQNVMEWTPTTSVPAQFQPKVHMATQQDEKQSEAAMGEGTKLSEAQTGKAEAASRQRINLQQMMDDFNKLSDSAFLQPGTGAQARLNAAKSINTAYSAMTGKNIPGVDWGNEVAALESIQKGSFRLGANLANSIGAREPGFIVAQSVQANPNIENSPTGFKIIASGLQQNALYEQDKKAFYDEYFSKFKHLKGASEAFDKLNPPEMYAKRAIMAAVDPVVIDDIKRYKASDMQPIIDKKYGRGTYKILTGG